MVDIKPSIVLEDTKSNKYFFYYRDSSIYYREISRTGESKDTMLISQANTDYAAAIDTDDTVYLVCNSRYKGVLLFIYTNYGWKFETVVNLHNSPNIYIMDMVVQNGSIHIFFSKKLPIANLYNVYHLHKYINEQTSYIDFSWRKNSLSEIYSQNIESSYSILPSKGGIIHYSSVWYDGTYYFINYYFYDDSTKSWIHKSLNLSHKNQVFITLLHHNKKINLLCFSSGNEESNIYHLISKSSSSNEIDFKELNNSRVETNGVIPLFYTDDKTVQLAWIKDHAFHQYSFDEASGKWRKTIDLQVTAETNILFLKIIKNSGSLAYNKGYFILDKNYDISRPIEHTSKNISEDKSKEKTQIPAVPEINDYLKQILNEIKDINDNVQYLSERMNILESKTFVQKAEDVDTEDIVTVRQRTKINNENVPSTLKKSNFKEKFMKNENTPNYESMLLNQDYITTFVGKPSEDKLSTDTPQITKINGEFTSNDKRAYTDPGKAAHKKVGEDTIEASESTYKYNNVFKKLREFFK